MSNNIIVAVLCVCGFNNLNLYYLHFVTICFSTYSLASILSSINLTSSCCICLDLVTLAMLLLSLLSMTSLSLSCPYFSQRVGISKTLGLPTHSVSGYLYAKWVINLLISYYTNAADSLSSLTTAISSQLLQQVSFFCTCIGEQDCF